MTMIARRFGLSDRPGGGVFCGKSGVFVGGVSLLERTCSTGALKEWRLRPVHDLNRDLSRRYGLPIEINSRVGCLAAIARALNRGDFVYALIAAPHLKFPDPLELTKSAPSANDIIELAHSLRACGLLKADWDPAKHPRWSAGSPGGIGGEFAPAGVSNVGSLPGSATRCLRRRVQASCRLNLFFQRLSKVWAEFRFPRRSRRGRFFRRMSILSIFHETLIPGDRNA